MERAQEDLLVLAAQGGDHSAFERLFRHYNAALGRFAYRLCGDEQLAKDAVQETWITLSKTLRTLQDPRGFRLWAYKTARWRTLDQVRRRGDVQDVLEEALTDGETANQEVATRDQLRRHMDRLPKAEKLVLTLFYLEELTVAEIAAIEGVPAGTVKSRLNRARTRLRHRMTGDEK